MASYVWSVNGKKNVRVQSQDTAEGALIPRVVYLDAREVKLNNGKSIAQGLNEVAPMYPKLISGDDYVLCMEDSGIFT